MIASHNLLSNALDRLEWHSRFRILRGYWITWYKANGTEKRVQVIDVTANTVHVRLVDGSERYLNPHNLSYRYGKMWKPKE